MSGRVMKGVGQGSASSARRVRRFVISLVVVAPCLAVLGCSAHGTVTARPNPSYGIAQPGPTGPPAAGNARFDQPPFDIVFDYPGRMKLYNNVHVQVPEIQAGNKPAGLDTRNDSTAAVAVDQLNVIWVSRRAIGHQVSNADLGAIKAEFDDTLSRSMGVRTEGMEIEAAGLSGLEYNVPLSQIPTGKSRIVSVFDGEIEYTLNCQSTDGHRGDIESACQTALDTLHRR